MTPTPNTMAKQAIVLYSSTPSSVLVENDQRALLDLLKGKKICVVMIDGANAKNKEIRSKLWDVSKKRAVYPQLFVRRERGGGSAGAALGSPSPVGQPPVSVPADSSISPNDPFEFIGDWEMVRDMNERNDKSRELDQAFEGVVREGIGAHAVGVPASANTLL